MPLLGATGGGSAKGFGALANLGYFIRNSLRFRASASAYLSRTPASAGNRQIMTYSFWVKRGALTADYNLTNATTDANNSATLYFNNSNNQTFDVFLRVGATNYSVTTSQVFRDPSAWYHIIVAIDTTQATSSNRTKVYVNGSQVTNFLTSNYVPQNSNLAFNNNVAQYIGNTNFFDGYLAEINFIDGQALTPSSFGRTDNGTGQWVPKKFAGTYGTNGFYLKFADASAATAAAIGKDSSGNGNNWTPNNISVTSGTTYDAMIDSPTLSAAASNYATLNPLHNPAGVTLSEGNLRAVTAISHSTVNSTFGVTSGKWYAEFPLISRSDTCGIGVTSVEKPFTDFPGGFSGGWWAYNNASALILYNQNIAGYSYSSAMATGQVWHIALDMDNGKVWLGYNGSYYGDASVGSLGAGNPSSGTNPTYSGIPTTSPVFMFLQNVNCTWGANFGQRPFAHTPPTGFKSFNTFNLP